MRLASNRQRMDVFFLLGGGKVFTGRERGVKGGEEFGRSGSCKKKKGSRRSPSTVRVVIAVRFACCGRSVAGVTLFCSDINNSWGMRYAGPCARCEERRVAYMYR